MAQELNNKYYVRKTTSGTWEDLAVKFQGLKVLSLDGMNEQGDAVNVYSEQWVNSQVEDFLVTTQDGQGHDVVIRKNVDLQLTFIVGTRYGAINTQTSHDAFINYVTKQGDFYIKSKYTGKEAHVVCLKAYKPTTQKLHRGVLNSFIMGTIKLHTLDAPQVSSPEPVPSDLYITVSPQRVTLGEQATIDVDVATTSDASAVEVYRVDHNTYKLVGRSSVVGRSWSFTDVDTPQDTESFVYRVEAAIGSDLKTAEARVTVEDNKKTVQISCGQDYASVVFEDTGLKLVNNMLVTFVPNDGDYLFIKVDKNDTVRNLYTNPAQGPDYEIPIDGGTVDGDYKYYKSTIQVTAGNMNCKINKSL